MISSYLAATSSGTAQNHARQAEVYIRFCVHYNINYLAPSIRDACIFIQFLANSLASPASVKNYLSGAKSWIASHGGSATAFSSPEAVAVMKGAAKLSQHIPSTAPALTPTDLKIVCDYLSSAGSSGLPVRAALLLGYSCFLRSSNLLSPAISTWSGPHTLARDDIRATNDGLLVIIRSSKTITRSLPVALEVRAIPSSPYCPVQAWINYARNYKYPKSSPAFMLASQRPLTPKPVVAIVRAALARAGRPHAARMTIHSLRRGAAQAAYDAGASSEDLKAHGTWKSTHGLAAYVPQIRPSSVPTLISKILGQWLTSSSW